MNGLVSVSGVSSTLMLRMETESSIDKFDEDTAWEPYPLDVVEGVLVFGANSARESRVLEVRKSCFTLDDLVP